MWDSLAKRLFIETSIVQLESATLLDVPSPLSMANETMEYVMLHEVQSAFLDMQGVYLKWDDTNAESESMLFQKIWNRQHFILFPEFFPVFLI